jgi:hypothetical protein
MGSFTITTTAPQDVRLVDAYGKYLSLGRNATAAEIKFNIIQSIKQIVRDQEYAVEVDAITTDPFEPT